MEKIDLTYLDKELTFKLILQRKKVNQLVQKIERFINQSHASSLLMNTWCSLKNSVWIITDLPLNKSYPIIPKMLFFVKSRLDPTYNWIVCNVISKVWKNYLHQTSLKENYNLIYVKLYAGEELKKSIRTFKNLRRSPGWKKSIKGGQFLIEVCKTHYNLLCILYVDQEYKVSLIERYARIVWKPDRIEDSKLLASTNSKSPIQNFDKAITLSTVKDFTEWEGSLFESMLQQTAGLFPVYKFGILENEEMLDYEGELKSTLANICK